MRSAYYYLTILIMISLNLLLQKRKKKNALMRNKKTCKYFFITIIYVDTDIHIVNSPLLEKFSFIKFYIGKKNLSLCILYTLKSR